MSKASGVPGKTPPQVLRAKLAAQRQAARDARTMEEQLALLDSRPGKSVRERARFARQLLETGCYD